MEQTQETTIDVVVYKPNYRLEVGLFATWRIMFTNMYRSRELIWQLFRRDFLMSYRKSFLGITWIVISPIIGIFSWVLLNSTGILQPGDVGMPYPAYVLISSTIWGLFMGFYGSSSQTLNAGSGFITQVNYPHEALLVKQLLQQFTNFMITIVINLTILILFGVIPHWSILFFPILALPMLLFASALGLIINLISVVASDVSTIMNTLLGFVFYITPVIYAPDSQSELLRQISQWNPLTYIVTGVRDLVLTGQMQHWDRFIFVTILSLIFFLLALRIFYVSEEKIVEKML